MDLILILIFLGLIVLALFLINNNSGEEAGKNKHSRLHEIAKDNNLNLDKAEHSSNLLLGLDENARKFIAIEPKNNEDPLIIDLYKYVECNLNVNESHKKQGKTNFISLYLIPEITTNKPVEIIFYDELDTERRDRSTQMQMAKRWRKHLDRLLK